MTHHWKNEETLAISAAMPRTRDRKSFEWRLGIALWGLLAGVLIWLGTTGQ